MAIKQRNNALLRITAATAVVLSVLSLVIFLIRDWPHILLTLSESDSAALSVEARLQAESALRTSTLSALAGIAATGVAVAALRQASLARKAHNYQRSLDWSKAFADAAQLLNSQNTTAQIAGVVGIRSLAARVETPDTLEMVASTLASFVRQNIQSDKAAVSLALHLICSEPVRAKQSLASANLANMDLTGLSFQDINLKGASFRESHVSSSEREYITKSDADVAQVVWSAE